MPKHGTVSPARPATMALHSRKGKCADQSSARYFRDALSLSQDHVRPHVLNTPAAREFQHEFRPRGGPRRAPDARTDRTRKRLPTLPTKTRRGPPLPRQLCFDYWIKSVGCMTCMTSCLGAPPPNTDLCSARTSDRCLDGCAGIARPSQIGLYSGVQGWTTGSKSVARSRYQGNFDAKWRAWLGMATIWKAV